jgi:uncharacterized membrane protein YfcA
VTIGLLIGAIIGLVLGLTGAGGSVFAVPMLILLLGLPVDQAVGVALGVVSLSALFGSISNWQGKYILWIPALLLGLCGAMLAPVGRQLGTALSANIVLLGFSVLAISIAALMWRQATRSPQQSTVVRANGGSGDEDYIEPICRFNDSSKFNLSASCITALLASGIVVGILSGLFGVGGGFLIVPTLVFVAQVSMRQAVATSLLIITLISGTGFFSFAQKNVLDWQLLSYVCVGGLFGMLAGRLTAHKIVGAQLEKIFALSLIAVTLTTLARQLG